MQAGMVKRNWFLVVTISALILGTFASPYFYLAGASVGLLLSLTWTYRALRLKEFGSDSLAALAILAAAVTNLTKIGTGKTTILEERFVRLATAEGGSKVDSQALIRGRVTGVEICPKRMRIHFWLAMPGALLMTLPPLLAGSVFLSVMQICARMTMQRRWRAWLNDRLLDRWLRFPLRPVDLVRRLPPRIAFDALVGAEQIHHWHACDFNCFAHAAGWNVSHLGFRRSAHDVTMHVKH